VTGPAQATTAGTSGETVGRILRRAAARRHHTLLIAAAWVGVTVLLYLAYYRQAASYGSDADGASNMLQAWGMLHGNLLLRGWWLSDVSFYTTELPEYVITELIRGLNATAETLAAAATYTLLVLLAAVVAKGKAAGAQGLARALIAGGIMLAPWSQGGGGTLLSVPNHTGTGVALLAVWLVIDRLGHRWFLPWLVGALLVWVQVADPIAVYAGAVPVAVVSILRLARRCRSWRADSGLLAAAAASVPVAAGLTDLIRRAGGYVVYPVPLSWTSAAAVPSHVQQAAQSVLVLFGANIAGTRPGPAMAATLVHLVGVILAGWALCIGVRRLLGGEDRLASVLVVGIAVLLAGYVVSNEALGIGSAHEIAPVLPFGAVLAGRLLPGRRVTRAVAPVLVAALIAYAGVLGYSASRPAAPTGVDALESWLTARHLTAGIGDYWTANNVTADTGGRVRVRAVVIDGDRFAPYAWETKKSWYEPPNTARFLVLAPPGGGLDGSAAQAIAQFGTPRQTAGIGSFEILVWDHNLLPAVTSSPGRGQPWPR
jgi:hypothetical protein